MLSRGSSGSVLRPSPKSVTIMKFLSSIEVVNGQVVKNMSVPTGSGVNNYRDSRRRTLEH